MKILHADNISKTYTGTKHPALENFSLTANKGEIVALLGESGCGKTTALRIIAGFETADKGKLTINDQTLFDDNRMMPPEKRGIGIVFQDYALFPHKTVWENITFGLFKLSKSESNKATEEAIALTGLTGFEKRYPHQLSGGQKQRVALARALAPHPRILLLDEPFSNIDTMKKNEIREDVRAILKKSGTTAIFVTHDTKDVLAIADRVVVMQNGRNIQNGTPLHVYHHPCNAYLANFFGKTNILQGTIVNQKLNTPLGELQLPEGIKQSADETVSVSIRPTAFKLVDADTDGAIPAEINKIRFMGEYVEIICTTALPDKPSAEIFVHLATEPANLQKKHYLKIGENGYSVLNND